MFERTRKLLPDGLPAFLRGSSLKADLRTYYDSPIVLHARFLNRLDDVDPSLGATAGAAEPLRAIVRVNAEVILTHLEQ